MTENNVIDFTAYKEARQTPVPNLLEWIKENLAKAERNEAEQLAFQERKKHNDNVIKSWRVNPNQGGRA